MICLRQRNTEQYERGHDRRDPYRKATSELSHRMENNRVEPFTAKSNGKLQLLRTQAISQHFCLEGIETFQNV